MYYSRKQLEYFGEPIGCASDEVNVKRYGGGKDGGDAPDYTALAASSEKAAQLGYNLGQDQLKEAQRQYELNREVSVPVSQAQLALLNQQQAQGDDYYNYGKQYSRPVEQSLYYESMGFTPEEIGQIEASRTREITAFNQKANTPVASTFSVPTSKVDLDIPAGAVQGSDVGNITIANPQPKQTQNRGYLGVSGIGYGLKPTITVKADPNAYYVKGANGTYSQVQVGTKVTEGTKTVTADVPAQKEMMQTPETDSLTAQLSATASARQKALEQADRDKLTGLNNDLAKRIGESDVDVYLRNKAAIDMEADQAVADSRAGFTNSSNNLIRQGLRYGMSPEKIAAASASIGTDQASKQASAANATRKAATQTMYNRGVGEANQILTGGLTGRANKIQDNSISTAKKLDVAGLYRNLPGASQGAYSLSLNAGNSAVANNAQAGNSLLAANQGAAGTIMQGSQQQIQGLSNIVNSQTAIANSGQDAGIWGALGQVGGAAISKYSDENVKKDIKPISDEIALKGIENTEIKKWKYDDKKIEGQDDKEHIGAMAQDLQKNLGDQVSDGRMVDVISAIGVSMAATKALSKKVDKLERKKK